METSESVVKPIQKDMKHTLPPGEFGMYSCHVAIIAGGHESTAKYVFVREQEGVDKKVLVIHPLSLEAVVEVNRRVSVGSGSANHITVPQSEKNSGIAHSHMAVDAGEDRLIVDNMSGNDTLEILELREPRQEGEVVKPQGVSSPKLLRSYEESFIEIDVSDKKVYLGLDENRHPFLMRFTDLAKVEGKIAAMRKDEKTGVCRTRVGDATIRCRELSDGTALFTIQNKGDELVEYKYISNAETV